MRLVFTRHGKRIVSLVPFEDCQLLEALEDKQALKAALAALEEADDEIIPWEADRDSLWASEPQFGVSRSVFHSSLAYLAGLAVPSFRVAPQPAVVPPELSRH